MGILKIRRREPLENLECVSEKNTQENRTILSKNDLAVLDKEAELTTLEIGVVEKLFNRIKNMTKNLIQGRSSR